MDFLPVGKLPAELLQRLIDRYVSDDPRVILGPRIGEDAAVIEMGDRLLVAKTDPVTFATDEIGWYAVHVNANDLACCGATPRWFLATLLLPENGATPEMAENIVAQIAQACRQVGAALCGGHTEITYGLDRPIVIGQMLGETTREQLVSTRGARVGDKLILTKGIAIEGTALIARERAADLQGVFSPQELERSRNLLHDPGISVVREALLAREVGGVHAMHDPTEGGVITGIWEVAKAAEVGLVVEEDCLPILPECRSLCEHFGLDPLGLIASGSLLIAAEASSAAPIVENLQGHGIGAAVIGQIVPQAEGCLLRGGDGRLQPLPSFARDEITRLFT